MQQKFQVTASKGKEFKPGFLSGILLQVIYQMKAYSKAHKDLLNAQ